MISRESLRLPIALEADCVEVGCDPSSTCVNHRCVPADAPCNDGVCRPVGNGCRGSHGPAMVLVDDQFCIDATEVINASYAEFLASKPSVTSQPSECAWNKDFGQAPPADRFPVVNVDWCDARAYCAWAGKRLCGKVGGGTPVFDEGTDLKTSEAAYACSRGGAQRFPYGPTHDRAKRNQSNVKTHEVGTLPSCEGGYPGIFDLSGNVAEWIAYCEGTEPFAKCRQNTWGFDSLGRTNFEVLGACDGNDATWDSRDYKDSSIGIRCCADK